MVAETKPAEVVFVNGFMGAGKSTVGAALAAELGVPFTDLDRVTETLMGQSIPDAIRAHGEAWFRDHERRALALLADTPYGVVALGGGTLVSTVNREVVRLRGVVVWLRVTEETAARRIESSGERPLFRRGLLAERAAMYADADFDVDTERMSAREAALAIAAWLRGRAR